jgi:hypothetical protein
MPVLDMRALSQPGGVFDSLADTVERGGNAYFRAQDRKDRNALLMRQLEREITDKGYGESLDGAQKRGVVPPPEYMAGLSPHQRANIEEAAKEHLRQAEKKRLADEDSTLDRDLKRKGLEAEIRKLDAMAELYDAKAGGTATGSGGSSSVAAGKSGVYDPRRIKPLLDDNIETEARAQGIIADVPPPPDAWGHVGKAVRTIVQPKEYRQLTQRMYASAGVHPENLRAIDDSNPWEDPKSVEDLALPPEQEATPNIERATAGDRAGKLREALGLPLPNKAWADAGRAVLADPTKGNHDFPASDEPVETFPLFEQAPRAGRWPGLLAAITGQPDDGLLDEQTAKMLIDRQMDTEARDLEEMDAGTMRSHLSNMQKNQPEKYAALKQRLRERRASAAASGL